MQKLLWCPIDVPPLPDISQLCDLNRLDEGFAYWRFYRLSYKQNSSYDVSSWKTELTENFSKLISWFENLPFLTIRNIKLNYQERPVNGHIDFTNPSANMDLWKNNHVNEPCGYRILVKGERTRSLWVENRLGNRTYCDLPIDTNVYVLNHTAGMHGVDDDHDRWTIFCHAEIDGKRHADLMAKSLKKYSSYAIWSK
jgi:hypothetical protein